MSNLTISIVNFNAGDHLLRCLESLRKISKELPFEVWIIDNASTDKSIDQAIDKFPEFKYLKNDENLGFGKAHNLVMKNAKTPYILTLNPDTIIPSGTIKFMYEFMENNPSIGVSSCKVEKENGKIDKASHRGFPTLWASFLYIVFKNDKLYHLTDRNMNIPHEVDSVVGAFMFLRKSVLEKIGYFDEDYFLYGEDIDLCFRIKQGGFLVMYVPEVKIIHTKGISSGIKEHSQSTSRASIDTRNSSIDHFYETMIIFYKKHYAKNHPSLLNYLVYSGINLKRQIAKRKKTV